MLQLQIITMFRIVKLLTFIIDSVLFLLFEEAKKKRKQRNSICIVPIVHDQIGKKTKKAQKKTMI